MKAGQIQNPTTRIARLVNPIQTSGAILVGYLSQLQVTQETGRLRHAGTPSAPAHQVSFPYYRVTVLVDQGQTGNRVSGFQPGT